VKPSSARKGKKCTRLVRRSALTVAGTAGANSVVKKLRPGRYRATLVATDAAGNRSRTVRRSFRVARKR
jgi:hypothetical protein